MNKITIEYPEVEPHYKKQAVEFIDFLFDNKLLHPDLTRKQISYLDTYLGEMWQIQINGAKRSVEILDSIQGEKK